MEPQVHNRIYCEFKPICASNPRNMVRAKLETLTVPKAINQVWSMDFMHDQLENGKSFKISMSLTTSTAKNLVSKWISQCHQTGGFAILSRSFYCAANPRWFVATIGSNILALHCKIWCAKEDSDWEYIQPGKPQQNAYVEPFNRTVRLNGYCRICFQRSRRCRILPPAGAGVTIKNAQTWPWADLRQCSSCPWPPLNSTSELY